MRLSVETMHLLGMSLLVAPTAAAASSLQPVITTVERVSRRVFGSVSFPLGHPWCNGKPTYWLIGHESKMEAPHCLVTDHTGSFANYNFTGSVWEENTNTKLQSGLDRHDCTTLDLNRDNVPDLVCGIGVVQGTSRSYSEIYLTRPKTNSIHKTNGGHGLWKYATMRHRIMTTLKSADNATLLAMATKGDRRADGKPNNHRIFKVVYTKEGVFKFQELPHPRVWAKYTDATCLVTADVNGDGLDDLILCSKKVHADIFIQQVDGTFTAVDLTPFPHTMAWRDVRVADVSRDGLVDLIVVGSGGREPLEPSYVRVFAGLPSYPFFDFDSLYYNQLLPYASPSVEVFDPNGDGHPDLYVVQVDEATPNTYCSGRFNKSLYWSGGTQPPPEFTPPLDAAPDLLLLNTGAAPTFETVVMEHRLPGCGFFVEPFGSNSTLLLGQGNNRRPGHNLILQWGV